MDLTLLVFTICAGLSHGSEYFATEVTGSWQEMVDYCEGQGAILASYSTAADVEAIYDVCAAAGPPLSICYLGFDDLDYDDQHVFLDGEDVDTDGIDLWYNDDEPHGGLSDNGTPHELNYVCGCIALYSGSYTTSLADCACDGFSGIYGVCEDDGCTTTTEYNVQIVLDESGSVGRTNYDNSVDFVKALIQNDISDTTPVSVFSFSNVVDELYRFDQEQGSRGDVLTALDAAKSTAGAYQGQCTDTLSALDIAVAEYERAANDGNLNDGPNFLYLLTDGEPYCGCAPAGCNPDVCGSGGAAVRARIDALNIRIFTLGVGSFDITAIQCLSDPADVFQVNGFTSGDFDDLEEAISETICPPDDDEPIVSPPIELGCQEAQQYCKDNYGTNLATIATDEDRAEAISILGPSTEAWIGLYSHETQTNWQFRSGEECPSDSAYKCVDFWLYQMNENTALRPRCIGPTEQGYECANFKTGEDGVDNDIPSMIQLPFLCDN